MNEEDQIDGGLRRVLAPVPADGALIARVSRIPETGARRARDIGAAASLWRWAFGLAFAGAAGAFALGLWLGGPVDSAETDWLVLLTGSEIDYMGELL